MNTKYSSLRTASLVAVTLLVLSLRMAAAEAISLPTAQELSSARLSSAIARGQVKAQGNFVFVICTDTGDGSSPVVVIDAPQSLSGAKSENLSFANKEAGSAFAGRLEEVIGHKDRKRLTGGYSVAVGHPTEGQPTALGKIEFSANVILSEGSLTMVGGGQTSSVDTATGKRSSSSVYVFAYYK